MADITEDQAQEALRQMVPKDTEDVSEPSPAQTEVEPVVAEEAVTAPAEEVVSEPEPEPDDITSLKKRLEDYEAQTAEKEKLHEARWKAFQDRSVQNEQILRDRYLRKASTADRALKVLKATRTEQGIPEAEVDNVIRDIEGTMNPASASYVPQPQTPQPTEEQAITLNGFLNEKGMTMDEANEFGNWVRSEGSVKLTAREQSVAEQSLDGFLRIAHNRWREDVSEKDKQSTRNSAVEAVKTVQRTQKDAARAASASPAAPRKTVSTSGGKLPDIHKMPKKEREDYLSNLIKESMEETR